jgi:hypothetical protein
MSNIIQKQINNSKYSDIQKALFKTTQENAEMKITHDDVKMLERYESLLKEQNKKIIRQL